MTLFGWHLITHHDDDHADLRRKLNDAYERIEKLEQEVEQLHQKLRHTNARQRKIK